MVYMVDPLMYWFQWGIPLVCPARHTAGITASRSRCGQMQLHGGCGGTWTATPCGGHAQRPVRRRAWSRRGEPCHRRRGSRQGSHGYLRWRTRTGRGCSGSPWRRQCGSGRSGSWLLSGWLLETPSLGFRRITAHQSSC